MSLRRQSGVRPGSGKSGETDTLGIIKEFRQVYEDKLEQIDTEGGGDCLQLKLKVQQRWIEDLTEQTELMVKVVEELEEEATERVKMLEDKLQQSAKCACEVMKRYQMCDFPLNLDEPLQRVFYLESDVKNLLEFIRRIRDDNKWNIDGLHFYEVFYGDLFGEKTPSADKHANMDKSQELTEEVVNAGPTQIKSKQQTELDKNYGDLLDDGNNLSHLLEKKSQEYEALKQSVLDMRAALTEEIASKHDTILMLKKDIQSLEERCVQSDKQVAFKDDIIKGMRKEIKQLKQQQKTVPEENAQDNSNIKKKESELEKEIRRREDEVATLRRKCEELENTLHNAQGRAANLQRAVDLYINSINVLESSEERAKLEIEQQRITISNLQESLVSTKQELNALKQRNQQDTITCNDMISDLHANLLSAYQTKENLCFEFVRFIEFHDNLKDLNFKLEVEHFNCLQDLACLETQVSKYQRETNDCEEKSVSKNEIRKLKQQKRCCEQIIAYFKDEMSVMSEQLINLQELLNVSNKSCKEENEQLVAAVVNLQNLNDRLQSQLNNTGQQVMLENQKNRAQEAKIDGLQKIIDQKNAELNIHDRAIQDIKNKLDDSLMENNDLQAKIASLNTSILQMKCAVCKSSTKGYNGRSNDNDRVNDMKNELNSKNERLKDLQEQFDEQSVLLRDARSELKKNKERQQMKAQEMKDAAEELKRRLLSSEANNEHWADKFSDLQKEMAAIINDLKTQLAGSELRNHQLSNALVDTKDQTFQLVQKNDANEDELRHYKETTGAFRQLLDDLCETLACTEFKNNVVPSEYFKNRRKLRDSPDTNNLYVNCHCEIALYRKVVEAFKTLIVKLAKNAKTSDSQNNTLQKSVHNCKTTITELEEQLSGRDQQIVEMNDKLINYQAVEQHLIEFIEYLKSELHNKNNNACTAQKDQNLVTTQEEITILKDEIKKMIENQLALNNENDKLLGQVSQLQSTVSYLEDENNRLKVQLDDDIMEIHHLDEILNMEMRQKEKELRQIVISYDKLEQKYRESVELVRKLETQLSEIKTDRDNVCAESKCVVTNVRGWLDEQRKINDEVKNKANQYSSQLNKLRQENETLISTVRTLGTSRPTNGRFSTPMKSYLIDDYRSPWSLDSQGNDSLGEESPCSFMTCSVDEWYSPNFKDDDENDDQEGNFIKRMAAKTAEMGSKNVQWRHNNYADCCSKNTK